MYVVDDAVRFHCEALAEKCEEPAHAAGAALEPVLVA